MYALSQFTAGRWAINVACIIVLVVVKVDTFVFIGITDYYFHFLFNCFEWVGFTEINFW